MRWSLLALLAGCTGGIAFEDYEQARLIAECEYYVRCRAATKVDDCRTYYQQMTIDNPNPEGAIGIGRLLFDEEAAESCVEAYGSLSCDQTKQDSDDLAICLEVYRGAVVDGGECAFGNECESKNCIIPDCPEACCLGTCGPERRLPGVGEPCTSVCTDDAYCGADSMCHALLPAGAACDGTAICASDLYCAGLLGNGFGVCTALPYRGEPCETRCAEVGVNCVNSICEEAGLAGAVCSTDAQCAFFYSCNADGTCGMYPTRDMPCQGRCSGSAWCSSGVCVVQKNNGESCTFNNECLSHYCGDDDTCAVVPICY